MLTVADLIAELSRFDPSLPVGLAVVYREGVFVDVVAAGADRIDVDLDDVGRPVRVWLVGSEPADMVPGVLTLRCACGTELPIGVGEQWPDAHDHCSDVGMS